MPLPTPAQLHVNWLTPEATALAAPALHRFVLGAAPVAIAFELPQTPFTGMRVKLAMTVQSAATALVVNVLPTSAPVQVPPTEAEKPLDGATANEGRAPDATVCVDAGVMVPLLPETLEVTV